MKTTTRYCYACDLKNDPELIATYKRYHKKGNVWPAIIASIKTAGIEQLDIYLTGNRLFMIMEVNEEFDPEKKATRDTANQEVQKWEALMWEFQQGLPWAKPGQKWVPLEHIFEL